MNKNLDSIKLLSGIALCIFGLYEQRKADGEEDIFRYIFGAQFWIAGILIMWA